MQSAFKKNISELRRHEDVGNKGVLWSTVCRWWMGGCFFFGRGGRDDWSPCQNCWEAVQHRCPRYSSKDWTKMKGGEGVEKGEWSRKWTTVYAITVGGGEVVWLMFTRPRKGLWRGLKVRWGGVVEAGWFQVTELWCWAEAMSPEWKRERSRGKDEKRLEISRIMWRQAFHKRELSSRRAHIFLYLRVSSLLLRFSDLQQKTLV